MAGQIEIHTEQILTKFANLALVNKYRLYRIWLVTPWIGFREKNRDPLIRLIEAVRSKNPEIILITRKPTTTWHKKAVRFLDNTCSIIPHVLPKLHAKIYVLECHGFKAAFLGSPNFSTTANRVNQEVAVEFRATVTDPEDRVAALIDDLLTYIDRLRTNAGLMKIEQHKGM